MKAIKAINVLTVFLSFLCFTSLSFGQDTGKGIIKATPVAALGAKEDCAKRLSKAFYDMLILIGRGRINMPC